MPWLEMSTVSQRCEYIKLVMANGVTMSESCRRFGISRKTGYKWFSRFRHRQGYAETSRRDMRALGWFH